jgi:Fe-S-cluster-containing dehydrogenase component
MIIDVEKCNGCFSCFLACRDEYAGNDYPPYSLAQPNSGQYWMQVKEKERGRYPKVKVSYIPLPCMHCSEAPCIKAAPEGAVFRRPDGIVLVDPEKAAGKKEILNTCPHRVIFWNVHKQVPQKCTFCAHLLDGGWQEPRCVEACPTGALVFGDLDDPESAVSLLRASAKAEALEPEYGLDPNVVYVGLPQRFIAGEVVLSDRPGECAEGVQVTLTLGDVIQTVKTDNYGDFEFEDLSPNNVYRIRLELEGYAPKEMEVQTRLDVNLGEILLERREQ